MPTKPSSAHASPRRDVIVYFVFVLVTSFFTYFYRYNFPPYPFWDEPYHVAAAQKYMHGVFFMEPHPPLGKLLIALGEKITDSNSPEKDQAFITTDYATGLGDGYSFTGYRLFPALLSWLTAPLLFFIFLWFTGNPALSTIFSFLYIFDNAEIVHSRGSMVDAPATFFGVLLILLFLKLQDKRLKDIWLFSLYAILAGLSFGLIMTTKVVGLIFILLFPAAVLRLAPDWRKIALLTILTGVTSVAAYVAVWQIHFSIGNRIVPELHTNGYYKASDEFKDILSTGGNKSLRNFPLMLKDSFLYMDQYEKGVPRLDLCKPDENGSPSYFWPFGARTINYRWERQGEDVRYLYLQSNPVTWICGLIGVLLTAFLLLGRVLNPSKEKLKHGYLMLVFFGLYAGYMIAISMIDRVMYLYHYFIPLLISYILFGLAVLNIERIGRWKVDENRRLLVMTLLALLIFGAFQMYRPLTYYEPISKKSFERLSIFSLWELTCVGCEKVSGLVVPVERGDK
jgi:dolichyl-phosphate-mannose-protein mannosyltransferase